MTTDLFEITQDLFESKIEEIYRAWCDGVIQSEEAVKQFCQIIGPLQEQQKMTDALDKQVRAHVSEVVEYLGGAAEVAGFGELKITNPSVSYSYDKKLVDKLTNQLRTEGMGDVAARLDACLKPSEKAGSLRITRSKEK